MSDLDRLREVGQLVRQPAFDELLDTRRRRTRRARIATATTLAIVVIAAVGALATTGHNVRTDAPPIAPSPSPTATERFEIPAGQQTIAPDIGPGDVRGWKVLATLTNSQPAHRGATVLATTVTVHTDPTYYQIYCRSADPSVWLFFGFTDGGGADGRCDEGSPSLPPPDMPERSFSNDGTLTTFRMFVARLSPEARACYRKGVEDCSKRYGTPQPLAATDVEFGFRVFDLRPAPSVLELFQDAGNDEPWQFEALSSIKGVAWLVDRAVAAAPDAHRLAVELPASDPEHLVDVYVATGPNNDRCMAQHADEIPKDDLPDHSVYAAAVDKVCGVDLRLVVDGTTIAPEAVDPVTTGHFSELGARLSPGTDHQVEVEVVRGDPRNIRYAVVVRTRTQMP
jgi:hypothetical protein